MNTYLLLKWIHILSSVLLVGTGFGSAFYLYFINRSKNVAAIAEVSRLVVRADWWFTAPTVILQPVSGLLLVTMAGAAAAQNTPLPERYWRFALWWERLGKLAFPSMLLVYVLMVMKPT